MANFCCFGIRISADDKENVVYCLRLKKMSLLQDISLWCVTKFLRKCFCLKSDLSCQVFGWCLSSFVEKRHFLSRFWPILDGVVQFLSRKLTPYVKLLEVRGVLGQSV